MNATRQLVLKTMFGTPECADSPVIGQACLHCMAEAVSVALSDGAPPADIRRHNPLAVMQSVCDHIWPPELDADSLCELCGLSYTDWSDGGVL